MTLLERGKNYAANVSAWDHVRLFSPWSYNTSVHGRAVLKSCSLPLPDDDAYPTGAELRELYLAHLWAFLQAHEAVELRTGSRVIGVTRGIALKGDMGAAKRHGQKFRVLSTRSQTHNATEEDGKQQEEQEEMLDEFDAVIDASGTYGNANNYGIGGLPAFGERSLRNDTSIVSIIPDVATQPLKYGHGRTTAVLGTGHSAITTINALRQLALQQQKEGKEGRSAGVKLIWATRRSNDLYEDIKNDPLPQRVTLNALGNSLCGTKDTTVAKGFEVTHLGGMQLLAMKRVQEKNERSRIQLTFQKMLSNKSEEESEEESEESEEKREEVVVVVVVDEVVANVGFRPDMSISRELQVHHCYATEGPMKLAAQLMASGSGGGDCLAQTSGGAASLLSPERGFLVLGMKSYGRSSKFLLKIGNEQIAHAIALLEGGEY